MRRERKNLGLQLGIILALALLAFRGEPTRAQGKGNSVDERQDGKRLFERETFGGNGRTCLTCHSSDTGTVSPRDAMLRFLANPKDPLFVHDGSDDGEGNGVSRMLKDATILVEIPLPPNVSLKEDPTARIVTLRRGIPTTLNTPALDPVLMLDGRAANLEDQAEDAIHYFHDNSAKTLEGVMKHYTVLFSFFGVFFTPQDQEDMVNYMKLLD